MFVGYSFLLGAQKEAGDKGANNSLNVPTSGSQWFAIGCHLSADFTVATRLPAASRCRVT